MTGNGTWSSSWGRANSLEEDPWIELAEVRKRLPDNSVFIDLARFEVRDFRAMSGQPKLQPAHYAAWITPARGNVQVIDLGPAEAIDTAVHKVTARSPRRRRPAGKSQTAGRHRPRQPLDDLARLVLHPLLPHIDKTERRIICPDGNLFLVPWAALSLANGHPAIEGHAISCVTSGKRPGRASSPPPHVSAPLVLANPDVEQQDKLMAALLPAPGTRA